MYKSFKKVLPTIIVFTLLISITYGKTYAESIFNDSTTPQVNLNENEINKEALEVFEDIQNNINKLVSEGIIESHLKTTEPIELGDGATLEFSETVYYDEEGNVEAKYSIDSVNKIQEVNPKNSRVIINEGGYSWDFLITKYSDTAVEHDGYKLARILLPLVGATVKNTIHGLAAAGLYVYITEHPQPALRYYKNHTYADSDSTNNYLKTVTYTYTDKNRTKLKSTNTNIVKVKK